MPKHFVHQAEQQLCPVEDQIPQVFLILDIIGGIMEEISQPFLNFSRKMVTLQLVLEKYFMEGLLVLQLMTINLVMIANIHGAKVVLITMLLTVIQKVEMYLGEDLINQH